MKIICKKNDLLNGINISLKAVPSKTTMSILECIVIEADEVIRLTSNNLELGIETIVEGSILNRGSVAINAKFFSDMIRKLPDNDVTIETDGNYQITISCNKVNFKIAGKNIDEFPVLPLVEKNNPIVISQVGLKDIIQQTVFSISDNESNKIMTGELFHVKDDKLVLASLDGHRISYRKIDLRENYEEKKVIIPGKTLIEITKILSNEIKDDVKIYFTDRHVLFELNNTLVLSRLVEGEYYKIEQMLVCNHSTKITVNRRELLETIDRSTIFAKENDKKPVLLDIKDGEIEFRMTSSVGSSKESIAVVQEGNDILIAFNPVYLMDSLRVISDDEVSIYLTNQKSPCFIKDDKESYIYLNMPINLSR